jgi:PAS domain S-box-containing protein
MDALASFDQLDKADLVERCLLFQRQLQEQKAAVTSWIEVLTKLLPIDQNMVRCLTDGLRFLLKTLCMDAGYIHLFDEKEHVLRLRACVGLSRRSENDLRTFPAGEGVPGQVWQKVEPLIATNIMQISDLSGKATQAENRMFHAGFPLQWHDKVLGTLTVVSKPQRPFTEDDISLLKAYSGFMAIVVQNSTLFDIVSQGKRQWEDAFDSMSDLVIICDHQFRIIKTNRAILERFWFPLEDAIGKDCFELLYSGNPFQVSRENLERMLRQGVTYYDELTPARQEGLFSIVVSPILTSDKLVGSIHVIKEITREKPLERNREWLSHNTSRLAAGTIGMDGEGRIRSWDAGAEATLGYSEEEMRKQSITVVLPSPDMATLIGDLKVRNNVRDFETTMVAKGGNPVRVSASLAARWDKRDRVKEVRLLIRRQASAFNGVGRP